jgi:3-hydroxymyristoyl/3-hydroxydecanoyl-(acyl carrier protein) dehydratase
MTTQPEVLGVSRFDGGVELALRIPDDLAYLPDHFPAAPMVPGVVQVDWAIAYGRAHLPLAGEFRGVSGLKFQQPLRPGAHVTLRLTADGGALAFAYRRGDAPCSAGRVQFGSAA